MLRIPLILYALELLGAAILLPLVTGIVARLTVLVPDKDDSGTIRAEPPSELRERASASPEPDPRYREPWREY